MTTTDGEIVYALHSGVCVLRFTGEIRYTSGPSAKISRRLDAFLDRLCSMPDLDNVVLDVSRATSIDSTNLGLLARIASAMRSRHDRRVTIISTRPEITRVLCSMGFEQVADLITEPERQTEELADLPAEGAEEKDPLRLMLDAHRHLASLDERNRETFAAAIELLEREIEG